MRPTKLIQFTCNYLLVEYAYEEMLYKMELKR